MKENQSRPKDRGIDPRKIKKNGDKLENKIDLALEPVKVNFFPGPQYDEKSRKWQGVPGIERAPNGRLWATWFSGGCSEDQFNHVVLVTSSDNGLTWSEPILTIDPPDNIRACDPVLWHDPAGRLWLFWMQGAHFDVTFDGRGGVWFIRCDNSDSTEPVWSSPRRIANGVMKNRPTVLSSGEWLFPCAVWSHKGPYFHSLPDEQFSNVFVSRDQGETFEFLGSADVPNRDCDEHMIVERRDGTLWMLVRVKDGIGEAVSVDRGRTWKASSKALLPGPCSRFHIRKLRSGRLLLINHFNFTGRSHLTAMLSDDEGATWPHKLLLDERTNVSYPDAVETPDGKIIMIYDRNRLGEAEILLQTFTEEDILLNRNPGYEGRIPQIISHAHRLDIGSKNAPLEDALLIDHMINVVREKHASGRVSIHSTGNDGEFILLPFRFAGSSLYLDFSTSPIGSIRLELQDFMGVAMKGYTLDDCLEIKGEGTENLVHWKQGHDVSAFAGQLIRMRFSMNNAVLFSFRFKH
jgi:predicted neuraminidase